LDALWEEGLLPVVTLASKEKFESVVEYAERVAADIADLLYDLKRGYHRDQPRIYVPRR
jgi:hypothetical protein